MTNHSETGSEVTTAPRPAMAEVASLPSGVVLALGALALVLLWLVGFDNGQITGVLDSTGSFAHELFHDGRHLLGVPCH